MQITKPRKQRKLLYQAPLHARHKHFSAPLSPKLKVTHGVNALPVRSGDTVLVTRGDHRGLEGKITRIDSEKYRVFIEGLTREKVDGTTVFVPVHPSKIMITRLDLDDKWRKKILKRKTEAAKKLVSVEAEKPIAPTEKSPKEKKKPKLKKKKAVKKKGAERAQKDKTKAKEQRPSAKKTRSKPENSIKAATPGKPRKPRRTGGGK
jgi:large subunit ribosomal protein L24